MDSFFIYRLPGDSSFHGGAGTPRNGIHPGFVLSSFYNDEAALLTIEAEKDFSISDLTLFQDILNNDESFSKELFQRALYPLPESSISKEQHLKNVADIIKALGNREKAICCAPICGDDTLNLTQSFLNLAESFPTAFVFCFYSPQSGIWIGASPELLMKKNEKQLCTIALAGTRPAGTAEDWDEKNIEEQKLVTDYIASVLDAYSLTFHFDSPPITKNAGSIEHLCTSFYIDSPKKFDKIWLSRFLSDFSPTPALCGMPKNKAYNLIKRTEIFSRGYYGGFIGPYNSDDDFSFFVLLRALRVERKRWCFYAGGGITKSSDPQMEWDETRRKASSILDKISYKE